MKTVVLDPGHGGKDLGAVYHENQLNLSLSMKVREKLLERYRVKVLMTRTKNQSRSPGARASFANLHHGDYFCSIHHSGKRQFESYISKGDSGSQSKRGQGLIHQIIVKKLSQYGIPDGGKKETDCEWLERVKMRAIFIQIPEDAARFHDLIASAIAEGLAAALDLPPVDKPMYQVVAGSFINKKSAGERVLFLEQQQIDAIVVETPIAGEVYYRVYAGAFRNRRNAEKRVGELKRMGLYETFITVGNVPKKIEPSMMKILGPTCFHGEEMDKYARYLNPDAPRLGKYYEDFGRHYGVRGDIAFAQALYETRHFRYTGVIDPEQHNYSRLGALSAKDPGDSFHTSQNGVLAHIQHLYALASTEPFPEGYPLVDPHFKSVTRGKCRTWADLNKINDLDEKYGQTILNQYEQMADFLNKKKRHWVKKLLGLIRF